ncbi:hypothetical protein [Neisseria sp. Ec49-e6-T10]|uniref:hypothetical protein n=1 Tax=Neisseria sp. Ec49-e6-T10 TaxID=3140744 RepID=UPI003EBE3BAA
MKQNTFIIQVSIVVTLAHILALYAISVLGLRTTDFSIKQDNTIMVMQLDGINLGDQGDGLLGKTQEQEEAAKISKSSEQVAPLIKTEKIKAARQNKPSEKILTTTAKAEFSVPQTIEKTESKIPITPSVSTETVTNSVHKPELSTANSKQTNSKGDHSAQSTNTQVGGLGNSHSSEGTPSGRGGSTGSPQGNADGSGVGGGGPSSSNRPVVVKVARTIKSSLKGKVSIVALVGSKNNLLSILDVSGDIPELREKARRLAEKGLYVSAKQSGQPIERSVKFTISFE